MEKDTIQTIVKVKDEDKVSLDSLLKTIGYFWKTFYRGGDFIDHCFQFHREFPAGFMENYLDYFLHSRSLRDVFHREKPRKPEEAAKPPEVVAAFLKNKKPSSSKKKKKKNVKKKNVKKVLAAPSAKDQELEKAKDLELEFASKLLHRLANNFSKGLDFKLFLSSLFKEPEVKAHDPLAASRAEEKAAAKAARKAEKLAKTLEIAKNTAKNTGIVPPNLDTDSE